MSSRPLPALILLVLAAFTVLSIAASSQSAAGFDVTAMAMYPQEVNGSYLIAVGAKVTTTFLFIFQKTCYYLDLYSYSDGTLTQLWNVSLSHEATAVALSPNLVAVGVSSGSSIFSSGSSSVEVFSTSGSGMWSVEYSYPTVTSLAISSADQVAVSVGGPSPEGAVYVYDESGDLLWNYSPSGYFGVHQLLFTPAGDLIVGAGNGYANGGWVIDFSQTGRVLWNVSTYDPTSLALGPNGVVVGAYVSYAFGGDNYVLEISDGRLLWVRDLGPNSRNTSLIWVSDSPNSALSAVAGNYGLHFVTGDGVYVLNYSLPFGDSEVAQSSNGSVVAVAELGGSQLLVFDYGEEIGSYSVGQIRSLAVNSQGNLIVVGTSNGLQAIQVTPSPIATFTVVSQLPSFYVGDVVAFSNSTYHLPAPVTLKLPTNSTRGSVRYLLDSLQVLGSGSGLDLGPGIYLVRANYTLQFLVEVVYPQTTSSGWYFSGSLITFPSLIQVNSTVRYSLIGRSTFTVTGPANVTPDYVKQYLVTLSLPNGTLSSWIDQDAVATIPALIQVNSTVRYSLVGPSTFIVTVPAELTPDYVKQYLVTLSLPNGTLSSWIDQDAVATIPALIQVNSTVRYSLIGRSTFTVTGPANVTPDYVKQYLVVIDGNSSWMDQGSTVRLYREVGFPFNVKWVGTYNVSNGRVVNVNGPIVEKAVRVLSLVSLAEVVVPVGGAGGLAYALRRRTRSARTFVGKGELVLVNGVVAVVVEVRREDGRNVYYVDFG